MTAHSDDPDTTIRRTAALGPRAVVLPRGETSEHPQDGTDSEAPSATPVPPPPGRSTPINASAAEEPEHPELQDLPEGITVMPPARDLFAADPVGDAESIPAISQLVHDCALCGLARGRTHAVPGEGPADAKLVVIGEGPGRREDETGRPFVGPAGDLLTKILAAIDLPREHVYICNVVKCRPPKNRVPQEDEIGACMPYLHRQIELIGPKVILAMGGTAATTLLKTKSSLGGLRGRIHRYRTTPVIVTYHPAALLRNPHWKRPTWDDIRIVRELLDS